MIRNLLILLRKPLLLLDDLASSAGLCLSLNFRDRSLVLRERAHESSVGGIGGLRGGRGGPFLNLAFGVGSLLRGRLVVTESIEVDALDKVGWGGALVHSNPII